ncbi:MAG: rhomboid family intramembrane serine protease [Bacteroidota bacterium]
MTIVIIIINVILSIICFQNRELFYKLSFNPYSINRSANQYYRIVTHSFIHADWVHLGINMFVLWSFGDALENYYSAVMGQNAALYLGLLYFGAMFVSCMPSWIKHRDDPTYNSVGASGCVSAVVFASIIFSPMSKVMLFPIPMGIPAFLFAILYLAYSFYMTKRGQDHVAHDAHIAGAVYGIVLTIAFEPRLVNFFMEQIKL